MFSDLIEKVSDFASNLTSSLPDSLKFKSNKNQNANANSNNAKDNDLNNNKVNNDELNEEGSGGSRDSAANNNHDGGRIYALWRLVLPVLLGLTLGWFAAVCLGVWLDSSGLIKPTRQDFSGNATQSETVKKVGLDDFLTANPFKISAQRPKEPEVVADTSKTEESQIVGSLATAVIKGTLPNVGVWIEDEGKSNFLLIGSSFDVYTLTKVSYLEAEFTRVKPEDNSLDRVILELYFGRHVVKRPPAAQKARTQTARAANANVPAGEVVSATEEQEGAIPSGLVNQLVQNPFDELKKVRLRPQGDAGLQIQWIQNDSILKKLGVQRGDIIKSINGIPFNNMADIANSINSLMNSERFDVEVDRKGKPTALRYVVR